MKTRQKRIAYLDTELFMTSSEHYSQIGADEIIEYSSENSGIPKAQMASAFYALNQQIRQFLLNGHSLELPNLGFLYLSVNAKATETEEEAGAKAVTRISVKFRQCKKLRELINTNVHLVNTLTAKENESSGSQNGGDNGGTSTDPSEGNGNSGGTGNEGSDNGGNSGGNSGDNSGDNSGSNTGGNTGGDGGNDDPNNSED